MIEVKTERRIDAGSCHVCGGGPFPLGDDSETVETLYVGAYTGNMSLRFCPKCFAAFAAIVERHRVKKPIP